MARELRFPKLGQTMESGVLNRWLISEGDRVEKGEPICEIGTDKTNIEYESPYEGTLLKLVAGDGQEMNVGEPMAYIGEPGEEIPESEPASGADADGEGQTEAGDNGEEAAAGVETGKPSDGGGAEKVGVDRGPAGAGAAGPDRSVQVTPESGDGERIFISPRARRRAREEGIDYTTGIEPTGPNGRIVERDILAAIERGTARHLDREAPEGAAPAAAPETVAGASETESGASEPATGAQAGAETTTEVAGEGSGEERRVRMSRMRSTIAEKLQSSARNAPHIYLTSEIDMTEAVGLREEINSSLQGSGEGTKVSFNDLIVRAVARTLKNHPGLNCRLDGQEIVYSAEVNIGVAVSVEDGLLVPVVRNADRRALLELSREIGELADRAQEGCLTPEEYSGGTFTVSNLGMFGIDQFTAIINPPESAILAVGRIAERLVPGEDGPETRSLMKVTLSCDHRVVDGASGARFLSELRDRLENPFLALI